MKKKFVIAILGFRTVFNDYTFDINFLANNKESVSKFIKAKEERSISRWMNNFDPNENLSARSSQTLSSVMAEVKVRNAFCDVGLPRLIRQQAIKDGLIINYEDFEGFVGYLRKSNLIDDLFYKNILASEELDKSLSKNELHNRPLFPPVNRITDQTKDVDLKTVYAGFSSFPDDVYSCSLGRYKTLALGLTWKDKKERDRLLNKLNYRAYEQKIISLSTYNKLETFREKKALDWPIHLKNYIDVVFNAKDKLSPTGKPVNDPSVYSTKYAERKERLTQRGRLYRNFDSTQVMMLSDIIMKTAKRMDSRRVSIEFQYEEGPDSEIETYVLSPMERYRLSIKMLRKDMGEIMRSELFRNTTVEYEDLN